MSSVDKAPVSLIPRERAAVFAVSVVLAALALMIALRPGVQTVTERDGQGTVLKTVESPREHNEVLLLLGAASFFLFFWGVNGLRLSRFAVGPVSGEAKPKELQAAEEYASTDEKPIDIVVGKAEAGEAEAEPGTAPRGTVLISDEAKAIYPLNAVPTRVILDLLRCWPEELCKPSDLSTFEFAARKTGRGNHPWIVKFRDTPAVRVSYGGQAKVEATVTRDG